MSSEWKTDVGQRLRDCGDASFQGVMGGEARDISVGACVWVDGEF